MPLPASAVHPTQQRAALPPFPNGSNRAGQYTLVFRIRHATTKLLLKEHKLVLFPSSFTQETESRTALYYTKGGIFADTPLRTGLGMTIFAIAGHTGYMSVPSEGANPLLDRLAAPILPESFVTTVQSIAGNLGRGIPGRQTMIDGAAAIKDLQDTIRAYFAPEGQPETSTVARTQDLQLEFLNLSVPTSASDSTGLIGWVIHPHRNLVSIRQDARQPFLYHYTFQFAGIAPLTESVGDTFVENLAQPQSLFRTVMQQANAVVTDLTNGVNTITDAFQQLSITNVTGPVSTLLSNTALLADAVGNFINLGAAQIRFPLYAQRTLANVLDAPSHSVTTLRQAAEALGSQLVGASAARSISSTTPGTSLTSGTNDQLTLRLNHETAQTLTLGTVIGGTSIANAIQAAVRSATPEHTANAAAYRDFTATYSQGQYTLRSGSQLSNAAHIEVVVNVDTALVPADASASLGLGTGNGGQEHAGTAVAARACALLRGLDEACTHLLAHPDFFAPQLDAQDAALAQLQPSNLPRSQIQGNQRLVQVRITPGDSLQAVAARVGIPWDTLALVNRLTYPYLYTEPTTLVSGRVSSAAQYSLSDSTQAWTVNVYQGQRVDILAGTGAGQSLRILRNTSTQLILEHAWTLVPNDTSDYAIRAAQNPIIHTSTLTGASSRTVTDSSLALVPDSQRGLTLLIASGAAAGARRRIVEHTATVYTLDTAWDVTPATGSTYVVLRPPDDRLQRQRVVGETLSVPQASPDRAARSVRSGFEDIAALTGRVISREEKLFGRDLLLQDGELQWDLTQGDLVTIAALPNLRQAMIHLINVPLGELEYAPGLGSYVQEELAGTPTLPSQVQLLQSVERTIRQDPRIVQMAGAQLFTQGGKTFIAVAAVALSGAAIDRIVIR